MGREVGSRLVYVLGAGDAPVKIGIADQLKARLTSLQIGCPDTLIVHHAVKVPFRLAQEIEADAHRELKPFHRRGEWFNVDKAVAIEVVNRLKAEKLADYQWDARHHRDLIGRLQACYELRTDVREAFWDYRDRLDAGDAYPAHANGYILKTVGMAAYAVFSIVAVQQKPITGLHPREHQRAEAALAKALNALAAFRQQYRKDLATKAYERNWNVNRDGPKPPSMRPPSLPPLRRERA